MPDVRCANERTGETITYEWQYLQHPRGTKMPDGTLIVWSNGGVLDIIEDRYMCRYWENGHSEWVRMTGSDSEQGETGIASCCQTPASWPADKRWLLAWSGSYRAEWGQAYRVWIGLATAPNPEGPWTCHPAAITSQRTEPVPPPPNNWWPPGIWSVAAMCVNDRVIVLGRDSGVHFPSDIPRHTMYEISQDMSSKIVGGLWIENERPASWIRDAAFSSDGSFRGLIGNGPHEGPVVPGGDPIEEVWVQNWMPDGKFTVTKTGRKWSNTNTKTFYFDSGFIRSPFGELIEPVTVMCNEGTTSGVVRGGWWLKWMSEDPWASGLLEHEPSPARVGAAVGTEIEYRGIPEMALMVAAFGPSKVEWNGKEYHFPQDGVLKKYLMSDLWPEYLSQSYWESVWNGETACIITLRGDLFGSACSYPDDRMLYPSMVKARFL
jgi:hypothetical protein